jgi:hypothetical protein
MTGSASSDGLRPYEQHFVGTVFPGCDWANAVAVTVISQWNPALGEDAAKLPSDVDAPDWADLGDRQLVRVATGYKPGREENPVDLARVDAAKLAGAVLEAIDDTFHYTRVGRPRANEAMHLLRALTMVDYHLSELRSHAIDDLAAALEVSDPDDR